MPFLKLKTGPLFMFCFFVFEPLVLHAQRRRFLKQKTKTFSKVKNWSNYVGFPFFSEMFFERFPKHQKITKYQSKKNNKQQQQQQEKNAKQKQI